MNNRGNQNWLPDVFGDFFDNNYMRRPSGTAPAINVLEGRNDYRVELAAPVHVGQVVVENVCGTGADFVACRDLDALGAE